MSLSEKRVTLSLPEYRRIRQLYRDEFYEREQISPLWLYLGSKVKGVRYRAYYDGDSFVAFSYTIRKKKRLLLYLLAVVPEKRSNGYGSEIVRKIVGGLHHTQMLLNVEAPDKNSDRYEQEIRRIRFYEKNGLVDTGYILEDRGDLFRVYSNEKTLEPGEYEALISSISLGLGKETRKCYPKSSR